MQFFRFRFVNTVLFFLLGILVGFILKERLAPSSAKPEEMQMRYQPEYETGQPAVARELEDQDLPAEESRFENPLRGAESRAQPEKEPDLTIEPVKAGERPALQAPAPAAEAALIDPAQFFRNTAAYAGRELELPLQMINTRKSGAGWRLNFSFMDAERRLNYLYVDDPGRLGAKPDLRIGYQYRVRFSCGAGKTDSGNVLTSVLATGEKADWATGMSAVEQ